jgi:hypothetical protein
MEGGLTDVLDVLTAQLTRQTIRDQVKSRKVAAAAIFERD